MSYLTILREEFSFIEYLESLDVAICFEMIGIIVLGSALLQFHSMARPNLNTSEKLVTNMYNATKASKYIRKRPIICINLSYQNLLGKSTSKCERCEVKFTS